MRAATLKLLFSAVFLVGFLSSRAQHETFIDGLVVEFPGKPIVSTEAVDTDLGPIDLHTYMYEVSTKEVYMVAYSDYGKANLDGMDPYDLLQGGKEGAMESLGITRLAVDKKNKKFGHPAMSFKGNNGTYYVQYEMLMVEDRLYQIAVLKDGGYPSGAALDRFMNEFRLEGSVGKPGVPPANPNNMGGGQKDVPFAADLFKSRDGKFAVDFPGTPQRSSETVNTDIGPSELVFYMYEKSNTEVFMVSYNDYETDAILDADAKGLLNGGRDGALGSLGIDGTRREHFFKKQGCDALYFTADNGEYFVRYEMILVGKRLYQVAVLTMGDAPEGSDVEKFFKSFKFKK